jgi:hypothetical protein
VTMGRSWPADFRVGADFVAVVSLRSECSLIGNCWCTLVAPSKKKALSRSESKKQALTRYKEVKLGRWNEREGGAPG